MKRWFQKLAVFFYEKMDCRNLPSEDFWRYHAIYMVPKGMEGKMVIAKINEQLEYIDEVEL